MTTPVDQNPTPYYYSGYSEATIEGGTISLDFITCMIEDFKCEKSLRLNCAREIIQQTKNLLETLPSLVDITIPDGKHIIVCGDIHGQFYDLIHIFDKNGFPSEENIYLFNGDYVNRGKYSVEVVLTLFAFKCLYPNSMHLTRGNHESRCMTEILGFEIEVGWKLDDTFISLFRQVFCCLPLAHVINNKVFVTHGGLFIQDNVKLSDIRAIDRFCEPPDEGLMCELLWSDPKEGRGRSPSKRGVGIAFGEDVTNKFLEDNELDLVVRSHEVKPQGYEIMHGGKLITIFSAPNYADENKGASIRFEAPGLKLDNISQYKYDDVLHRQDTFSVHLRNMFNEDD